MQTTASSDLPYDGSEYADFCSPTASPRQNESGGDYQDRNKRSDDQKHGEFIVEDISNENSSKNSGLEVIRPYQYEEAGAESSAESARWEAPKCLEYDEISNSSLVESIETLCCDSEREIKPRRRRTHHRTGLKRKPSWPIDRKPVSRSHILDDNTVEGQSAHQYVRPRKVRKSNPMGEYIGTLSMSDSASELTSREDNYSSAMVTSGETSEDDTVSRGDPMDIDT
ncbi:hypothetical protein VTO42DRAFT_3513 [Malbranchea cinnamomea]